MCAVQVIVDNEVLRKNQIAFNMPSVFCIHIFTFFVGFLLKLMGTLEWLQTAVEEMKSKCETIVNSNTSFWHIPENKTEPEPPREILGNLCIDDCNGNGNCSDGRLSCDMINIKI